MINLKEPTDCQLWSGLIKKDYYVEDAVITRLGLLGLETRLGGSEDLIVLTLPPKAYFISFSFYSRPFWDYKKCRLKILNSQRLWIYGWRCRGRQVDVLPNPRVEIGLTNRHIGPNSVSPYSFLILTLCRRRPHSESAYWLRCYGFISGPPSSLTVTVKVERYHARNRLTNHLQTRKMLSSL